MSILDGTPEALVSSLRIHIDLAPLFAAMQAESESASPGEPVAAS